MILFFILSFFCSCLAVELIVFDNDVIFNKNLFVVNTNIVGNDVAVNGGINCANSFASRKVYLNTDLDNANYLMISSNDNQVNIYIKNLPALDALSYYLVLDPVSSLLYYFKPDAPQPKNLVADKIFCNTIAGYNSDNLIVNNMPGDTTIGNSLGDLYLTSDTILIDGEVSSLSDNIVFESTIQSLDTLTVNNISANKFSFEESASTVSTIQANSFLIKNLVLNQSNICSILTENQIAFQDSVMTNELIFSNQDANVGIIIKNLSIDSAPHGLLVFDPVAKGVSLFPIQDSLTLNNLAADRVTVISDIDVINNSFFINLSANTVNFSSLSGSQNLVVNGNLNFGNQFSIKNKVTLQGKASFLISAYASTVNLANNTTPIQANNFLVASEWKDPSDTILLTINGFVKILYPVVTSLSNYTFLGVDTTSKLIQIPGPQNFFKSKMKLADMENFKKSFAPKIFQYRKEYSLDIDPISGAQVKRLGLIVEDIQHFKYKNLLKNIIERDDAGKSINYNERIVAEMALDQLNLMSKKLKNFKKVIIAEKNSLLKIKKLIEKVDFEISALSKE
jgi:hypothetical protein